MQERNRFIKLAKLEPDAVPSKKLNVSTLSEGLRKEVKALIKEGKTKFSEFPAPVRSRIQKEMAMPKLGSGTRGFTDKDGRFVATGSHMGRGSSGLPVDKSIPLTFEIENIMERGSMADYDKGGAYWGGLKGEPVYRAYAELPEPVEFVTPAGYSGDMQDVVELFFRAKGLRAARKHILSIFPNATFVVSKGMEESISTKADGKPFQLHFTDKNGVQRSAGSNSREELQHYAELMKLTQFEITPKEGEMTEGRSKTLYSAEDFKRDLEAGPYAWPGGYPLYFIMSDGEAMSYEGAKDNAEQIISAIEDGDDTGWRVVGKEVNWEDPQLYCCQTNKRIPSAYADDEAGTQGELDEKQVKEDFEFGFPEEKYPELRTVVDGLAELVLNEINKRTEGIQSKMPYKAQWVLEELIKELKKKV